MLTIVRGLPGSGKSTLAIALSHERESWYPIHMGFRNLSGVPGSCFFKEFYAPTVHIETDMYFVNPETGGYKFEPELINEAHKWCQNTTKALLEHRNVIQVIVSNTFCKEWEVAPYRKIVDDMNRDGHNAQLQIITVHGNLGNVHNVPQDVLDRMREGFEDIRA